MAAPVVSIVGRSDTGKTTLIEKLLKELTRRGYRAATIKHDVHGFEIDKEGKDSYRHKHAGAVMSIISSPAKIAVIKDVGKDMSIDEIAARFIDDVDIILTEGYKRNDKPKIEVYRAAAYPDLLCTTEDDLIAIATDTRHGLNVPQVDINDAPGLVDIIEERILKRPREDSIRLVVDGRTIALTPFIQKMLTGTIRGMIGSLKGCSGGKKIDIKISG